MSNINEYMITKGPQYFDPEYELEFDAWVYGMRECANRFTQYCQEHGYKEALDTFAAFANWHEPHLDAYWTDVR